MLPHSVLGRLEKFAPKDFCTDRSPDPSLDAFVLSLALVFNDLKDIEWAFETLHPQVKKRPTDWRELAVWGQCNGALNHIQRLRVGLIVELMNLIRDREEELQKPLFTQTIRKISKVKQNAWSSLVRIARERDRTEGLKTFLKFLIYVRANGTYHYNQTKAIRAGFVHHYAKNRDEDSFESLAFLCRGQNMESSRFFFADAAIAGVYSGRMEEDLKVYEEAMKIYRSAINQTIRYIVPSYLRVRRFQITKVKDSEVGNWFPE